MGTMKIPKLALKISIPMVISMISIALYEIIDTIFISNIGINALTTTSLSIPVIDIITAIGLGTSIGINSIVAKTLGENNKEKVKKIIVTGIILILFSWIFIALLSIIGMTAFFKYFSDNIEIQSLGYKYLIVISVFSFGSLYQLLFTKILEAYGKSKLSMWIQFSGSILNLVLDPILIFGIGAFSGFGIMGAAIATVLGQVFGMFLGIYFIVKEKIFDKNLFKEFKLDKNIIKEIYVVGFPIIIMEAANSVISLILNKILINFSESAVAVWGIYSKLQKFVIIIVYGLNYGMIPIIAYNWGAKNKQRVKQAISFFMKLVVFVTFTGMLLFIFIPKQLINIYSVDEQTLQLAINAFRILSIGFVFAGLSLMLSATSQALGNGTHSLIVNLSRKIIFVIPLIFLLKGLFGINAVWIAFTVAEIITTIIATILYFRIKSNVIDNI